MNHFHIFIWLIAVLTTAIPVQSGEESNHDRDDLRATTVKPAADPSGPPLGPDKGTLVLCSTQTVEIRDRFIALAGGHDAHIVVVINPMQRKSPLMRGLKSLLQTLSDASSAGSSAIANSEAPPTKSAVPETDVRAAANSISTAWGVKHVFAWRADNAKAGAAEPLLAALTAAEGVWFLGGFPDLNAEPFVDSPAHREFRALLDRGGVIGGESGGAMIQTSHVMHVANRGNFVPPATRPFACFLGFGFLRNIAIFPHFGSKFQVEECQKVIDGNPGLFGVGIKDGTAVIVKGGFLEIIGKGEVTVLANQMSKRAFLSGTRHSMDSLHRLAMPDGSSQ